MKEYKNIITLKELSTDKATAIIFCDEDAEVIEEEIRRIKQEYYEYEIDRDYVFSELEYIFNELCNKYDIDYYITDYLDEIYY